MVYRSPLDLELSRIANGVPADWSWAECQADCGDVVWFHPDDVKQEPGSSVEMLLVCSNACAIAALKSRTEGKSDS